MVSFIVVLDFVFVLFLILFVRESQAQEESGI